MNTPRYTVQSQSRPEGVRGAILKEKFKVVLLVCNGVDDKRPLSLVHLQYKIYSLNYTGSSNTPSTRD